jgi:hypothetical protein
LTQLDFHHSLILRGAKSAQAMKHKKCERNAEDGLGDMYVEFRHDSSPF